MGVLALAAVVAGLSGLAVKQLKAGSGCCDHCGCVAHCETICRLVTEEKKVEVACWGCKCENFCVGCHSTPGCTHCEEVCTACDEGGGASIGTQPRSFVWTEWFPRGAKVYTKKKLMKKIVTKKVPTHKWVVEELCPSCRAACR